MTTTTAVHITPKIFITELRKIIKEVGPDYVYRNTPGASQLPNCSYVCSSNDGHEEKGCLIGRILENLGVDRTVLAEMDVLGTINLSQVLGLLKTNGITWDKVALAMATSAQFNQDNSVKYGELMKQIKLSRSFALTAEEWAANYVDDLPS